MRSPDNVSTRFAIALMASNADRAHETWLEQPRRLRVDRQRAEFGAWYEAFPRSWGSAGRHGTLADFTQHLGYIKSMGFPRALRVGSLTFQEVPYH